VIGIPSSRPRIIDLESRRAGAIVDLACGALRVLVRRKAPRLREAFTTACDDSPVIIAAVVLRDQELQEASLTVANCGSSFSTST